MLDSKASQFSLSPKGEILWQEKLNNPLPGVLVARLGKGSHPLKPELKAVDGDVTGKHDAQAVLNMLKIWFKTHLSEVLEPLVLLEVPQGVEVKDDAVSRIAAKVYDGLGIVAREDLEDVIAELTPETRADLRVKKIRLGPILAFIPALNKPAAVKLRALLWSLYNDQALPAKTPADGIVSVRLEEEKPDEQYYRAIGYPFYGGRVVRIDMLDRVICCIYDHAQNGKFQARHEMAEWLGCSIGDLYKVLEAMGHKKTYDPAEEAEKAAEEVSVDKKPMDEAVVSAPVDADAKTEEEIKPEGDAEKPKVVVKPELATFRLKKGKAHVKSAQGGFKDKNKTFSKDKGGVKSSRRDSKKKDKKKKDTGPRVVSIEAKKNDEDSPFAVLQQLKK